MNSVLFVLSALGVLGTTSVASARNAVCTSFYQPVAFPGVDNASVRATLCWDKFSDGSEKKALVFTHGSTAKGSQINSDFQPQNYSVTEKLVQMGWIVLYYDRIGTGDSTVPPDSALVTVDATVLVMHQLTSAVRDGTIGGGLFDGSDLKIACAGASLGTGYTWEQAVHYPGDCDALVTWGFSHDTPVEFVGNLYPDHFFPAYLDPVIDNSTLFWDPSRFNPLIQANTGMGYITTTPMQDEAPGGPAPYDTEWRQFYFLPTDPDLPNPHLVAIEELDKSFVSAELVAESAIRHAFFQAPCGSGAGSISCAIPSNVPVIQLVGPLDRAACGMPGISGSGTDCSSEASIYAKEAPYYTTSYEPILVDGAAHEIQFGPGMHRAIERMDASLMSHWGL